ncbi:MAG: hypothetical protein K2Z80_09965, partial [Xanthobacteraceae bacterium]|nr:hypothetical protein [Xanthobacteraceae bacterium]
GAKLPGGCLPDRRAGMVDLMSLDPSHMPDNNGSTTNGGSRFEGFTTFPGAEKQSLKAKLRLAGWRETTAFIEPDGSAQKPVDNRSAEAERKAEQRERDLAEGWRQHNVKAPDDPDARELLSYVAQALKSKKLRRIIRSALSDPDLVMIGRRVRRLRGDVGDQVRKALGL